MKQHCRPAPRRKLWSVALQDTNPPGNWGAISSLLVDQCCISESLSSRVEFTTGREAMNHLNEWAPSADITPDYVMELKSAPIYRHLQTQSVEYAQRIETFVAGVAPILATTKVHFPLYTRHDAHHGFCVVRRIGQILKPTCLASGTRESLSPTESFLLIAAAYTHDLGMTVFPEEGEEIRKRLGLTETSWHIDERLTGELRREHSKRGGQYIKDHAEELGLPSNLISPLDKMMRSHNMSIEELERDLREPFAAEERPLDIRQLAAVLCIADAIEFSDTRVLHGVIEEARSDSSQSGRQSYRENRKHDCIRDSLALDEVGQIVVSGTFDEPDVLALAHRTFDEMESWIRSYCDIDRSSSIPRLHIRPEPFRRHQLNMVGARFERLGVRMSKRSVIDLIASNAVWQNDPGIAVRELVQNAVEACRYRAHHSSPAENYVPLVRVVFNRVQRTIHVHDNGCGMSVRTVLDHFLTVGNSRSKAAAYSDDNYAPIARFGIGFWSVFTIAEQAEVETRLFEGCHDETRYQKRSSGISFKIALDVSKDYTVFEEKAMTVGTTITLFLKPGIVLDEIVERARGHLLATSVPVSWVTDEEEIVLPKAPPTITPVDLLGARRFSMEAQGITTFDWQGEVDGINMSLAWAYRLEGNRPTFRANKDQSILNAVRSFRYPQTAVCGFKVSTRCARTCFALERVGYALANHQSPKGFEFSLDRQNLIENEAQKAFAQGMATLVHKAYRIFLRDNNAYHSQTIWQLNEESELNGGNVFDQYTGGELVQALQDWPDLLCVRLLPVQVGQSIETVQPIFANLEQLQGMTGFGWVLQNHIETQLSDGRFSTIYSEQLLPQAYALVQSLVIQGEVSESSFLLDPNRRASMLFDADPHSTVKWVSIGQSGLRACLQRFDLAKHHPEKARHGILAEIQGRWSGAIYTRNFEHPEGKPYVFLGRYRVLIQPASRLHIRIAELKADGRLLGLASLINDLQEDNAGFTPDSLRGLL